MDAIDDAKKDRVYPRVCGGTHRHRSAGVGGGSIPACAGEPTTISADTREAWKGLSPRVRGNLDFRAAWGEWGLSPRVRGKQGTTVRVDGDGSIPACAGEP